MAGVEPRGSKKFTGTRALLAGSGARPHPSGSTRGGGPPRRVAATRRTPQASGGWQGNAGNRSSISRTWMCMVTSSPGSPGRQRRQEHGVDEGEDRRRRPDAQPEPRGHDGGESGAAVQPPRHFTQVPGRGRRAQRQAPDGARVLPDEHRVPDPAAEGEHQELRQGRGAGRTRAPHGGASPARGRRRSPSANLCPTVPGSVWNPARVRPRRFSPFERRTVRASVHDALDLIDGHRVHRPAVELRHLQRRAPVRRVRRGPRRPDRYPDELKPQAAAEQRSGETTPSGDDGTGNQLHGISLPRIREHVAGSPIGDRHRDGPGRPRGPPSRQHPVLKLPAAPQ